MRAQWNINADFTCRNCGRFVSANAALAGVNNRNHCPYCLWSRHLDLFDAGDRLSPCRALMRPLALAVKHSRKKYGGSGELMLVHRCEECGGLSLNRIAADDLDTNLLEVYTASLGLPTELRLSAAGNGINLLGEREAGLVRLRLFGAVETQQAEPRSERYTLDL